MRARIRHELKCWPEFFEPTLRGLKQFELRRDDREGGFQVGDELLLKEWDPIKKQSDVTESYGYTGREVLVRVGYVMPAERLNVLVGGLLEGFVLMSVRRVS